MIDPRQVADALNAAERDRKPIRPFSDEYPFFDVGRAYQAQRLFVADHLNSGDRTIGAKLGMTSRVMRSMLGVDQPVSGWLTAAMALSCGQPVPLDQLIHPRAEPEIALMLGVCLSCRAVPLTNIIIELQEGDRLKQVPLLGFNSARH